MSTPYLVVGGVAVAGIAIAALAASSSSSGAPEYSSADDPLIKAIVQTDAYFNPPDIPVEPVFTQDEAQQIADVSEQQDEIYTAGVPVWQGYGTNSGMLTGWQADYVSLFGVPDAGDSPWKESIATNYANAQSNKLTANQNEAMINWIKLADYAESQSSTNPDLTQMEQEAAWLKVNEPDKYKDFVNAWMEFGGTDASFTNTATPEQKASGFVWTTTTQNAVNQYAMAMAQDQKTNQYGAYFLTAAPMVTDSQGNAVNEYTGTIMVGDSGPTGTGPAGTIVAPPVSAPRVSTSAYAQKWLSQ
jgi:hypothetical protein